MGNPAIAGLPRIVIKDFTANGVKIKKGDMLACIHAANYRRDSWFENPEKFDIDRHLPENSKKLEKGYFMPFSLGKRNCVGKNMGEIMVKLIFASMLQRLDIRKPVGFERKFVNHTGLGIEKCMLELNLK